jgi:hypothetical protein
MGAWRKGLLNALTFAIPASDHSPPPKDFFNNLELNAIPCHRIYSCRC